jgi:DNA-binding transcriptional LysR family regulator
MDGDKMISMHPQGRFKADNGTALAAAAVAGLGVAALPDFLIADHLAAGSLVPVMQRYPPPEAGIYVVRPPGQHLARKIRVLTELLIEHFGSSPECRAFLLPKPSKRDRRENAGRRRTIRTRASTARRGSEHD